MYLRHVHSLCVAERIGDFVLPDIGSLLHADELPEAVCLDIWVYIAVEDEIGAVARVGAVAVTSCGGEHQRKQQYQASNIFHSSLSLCHLNV